MVGTPRTWNVAGGSQDAPGEKRSWTTAGAPAVKEPNSRRTGRGREEREGEEQAVVVAPAQAATRHSTPAAMLAWVSTAPLGRPVVPEV